MIIACALVYVYKFSGNEAISYVRMRRPGSIQTRRQVQFVRDFAAYLEPAHYIFHPRALAAPAKETQNALSQNDGLLRSGLPLDHYVRRQRILLLTWEQGPLEHLPRVLWSCARALVLMPADPEADMLSRYLRCDLSETEAKAVAHLCTGLNCGDWARLSPMAGSAAILTVLRRFLASAADALVSADELRALFENVTEQGLSQWRDCVTLRTRKSVACAAAILRSLSQQAGVEASGGDSAASRHTLVREAVALHLSQLLGDPHRPWPRVEGVQLSIAQLLEDASQDTLAKVALELRDPLKALHHYRARCDPEGTQTTLEGEQLPPSPIVAAAAAAAAPAVSRDVLLRQNDVVLACVILNALLRPDPQMDADLFLSADPGQQADHREAGRTHCDEDLISAVLPTPPSPALQERLRTLSIYTNSDSSAAELSSLRAHDVELSDFEESTDDEDESDTDDDDSAVNLES
jgi:hypothetical protein